jgi:hypothetical protein
VGLSRMAHKCYYNEIDPQKAAWLRELIARDLIAPGDVDERSIADVRAGEQSGLRLLTIRAHGHRCGTSGMESLCCENGSGKKTKGVD